MAKSKQKSTSAKTKSTKSAKAVKGTSLAEQAAKKAGINTENQPKIPRVTPSTISIKKRKVGYKVKSDKQVAFTQAKASEYINLPVLKEERKVCDADVEKLRDHMIAKTFNYSNTTLASAFLNGVRYKVNGQHTAWAKALCEDAGVKNEKEKVREIVYQVDDEESLRELYATFDAGKSRSKSHRVHVLLASKSFIPDDLSAKIVGKLANGFAIWKYASGTARKRVNPSQLVRQIEQDYGLLFEEVANFLKNNHKENPRMLRAPVVAAMFATFNKVSSKSTVFWTSIADGMNVDSRTDPRYVLRQQLEKMMVKNVTKKGERSFSRFTEEDIYRSCIGAWNKWRSGVQAKAFISGSKKARVKAK